MDDDHDSPQQAAVPVHWHRRVLTLAFPIVLANLTQPILGAVDTAVAGHLDGPQFLGGVALGGLVFSFVFWSFGFLRMGTTGLVAQAYGARDDHALRASVLRALMLALGIGLAVLVLQVPIIVYALSIFGGSAAVNDTASAYCHARIWAAPFALGNYVVLGYLLGCQRVRLALVTQVFINAVNIVAVLLFVYRFGWGISGIGAATAFADFCGFALGIAIMWRLRPHGLPPIGLRTLLDTHALKRLIAINRDIFIRTLCLLGSFAWFTHMGARQGDAILAANALLLNFQTFMAFGLDGFAHAAEALVGAATGARDRIAFRQAVKVTMLWSVIGAAGFSLVYWIAGERIIAMLTDQAIVREAALRFLPWAAIEPLAAVLGFQLDSVYIGATRTRELMQTMVLCLIVFALAMWALAGPLGNHGLWLALTIWMLARGVMLLIRLPRIERASCA
ncbi:MATE family efflux transporter [Candidatus Burkholderia verschuerenii]|uniref:MATE family efflux transporter n=1 Tax=Candidatus Burkholderia verschuerenii TaxID=242163 RepID=UPI00067B0350|nr:MATE family efflux transporter [Candidatus Burkholderia verschuerenii]